MSINSALNNMDRKLNQAGMIPVLSTVTGAFRIAMGVVETVAGIAMGIFGFLAALFGHSDLLRNSAINCFNGLTNILRGSVEIIPVAGNLLMFVINSGSDSSMQGSIVER